MMFRFLICAVAFLSFSPAYGAEEEGVEAVAVRQVPIITFRQKVECITEIQKNPAILQAKFDQKDDAVDGALVIANDQTRDQAKEYAYEFIRLIKRKSLDDEPDGKKLGKGLYTYKIIVSRANKALLATGVKRFDEKEIEWAINDEGEQTDAILEDD